MIQFKTVALPATTIKVKKKDMFTVETANLALAPVAQYIQNEAKGGWILHSYVIMPATVWRKKGLKDVLHFLLGWIPVLDILFKVDPLFEEVNYCSLIFQKEV